MKQQQHILASAPLIKRLLSMLYDILILMAVSMAYWSLATFVMVSLMGAEADNYQPMQKGMGFQLGWLLTIVGFYWFFWVRGGQTIGMRAWRIKLISRDMAPLSHQQCLVRIVSAPLSVGFGGLGYLWCLLNRDKAAWHDLISGTRVVSLPKRVKKT